MERITNKKKIRVTIFLSGVFLFQLLIVALLFVNISKFANISNIEDVNYGNENSDETNFEEVFESDLPTLTRTGYPVVLDQSSAGALWTALHGKHINNFRIVYFSEANEWVEVPFQMDEKAYFLSYKYEMAAGADVTVSFISPSLTDVDLNNMGYPIVEHRYAGMHFENTASDPYEEPTKWEADNLAWDWRSQEQWQGEDMPWAPTAPTEDTSERPGGAKEQLERRLDWDDELCFYAERGQKITESSWWNPLQYPLRAELEITDQVDGGQSWMYVYYNDDATSPPSTSYYIPSGATDHVSWDKNNLKIIADTYELQLDANNLDLDSSIMIKWSGLPSNNLIFENNKQYYSSYFRVYYYDPDVTLNENSDLEMWREGEWEGNDYDEQLGAVGYDIPMEPGWNDGGSNWPGHRIYTDPGVSSGVRHTLADDGDTEWGTVVSEPDTTDHDGDEDEIVPHIRGIVNTGQKLSSPVIQGTFGSKEAAIDGPCRVILDRMMVQFMFVTLDTPVEYEELWRLLTKRSIYYGNMMQDEPYSIDMDLFPGYTYEFYMRPHFLFYQCQRLSDYVRNDANSYVLLGEAPNGVSGINQNYPQAYSGTKTWPLYLYPDGSQNGPKGNDGVSSGGGPTENHYNDAHLLPGSGRDYGSNPPADNPLSDWRYLHTSSGGMWTYVPYQEMWQLFQGESNRDLATYWRDDSGYSEMGIYGNDADQNGATDPFVLRTVFGVLADEWECQREYARHKTPLSDNVVVTLQTLPEGDPPIFEGVVKLTGDWCKDGDTVEIEIDMDGNYGEGNVDADFDEISDNAASTTVDETDDVLYKYKISHIIDSDTRSDRVPPSQGYAVHITVTNTVPEPDTEATTTVYLYLDNTDPDKPTSISATQDGATVILSWSGEYDNGQIDSYEIYRNSIQVGTLAAPASQWTDTNIVHNEQYTYVVRVIDRVGNYVDSDEEDITVDLSFDPAIPDDLPEAFRTTVTIDWNANPGYSETGIDSYMVYWSKVEFGTYTAITPSLPSSARDFIFDPLVRDPSPQDGTYYFKLESYDSAGGGVSIMSPIISSIYDTGAPFPGVIQDVPDLFEPITAEIPIHWSGEFDAFSGIDYFQLYRDENQSGSFDPEVSYIASDVHDYYDTNLANNTIYEYYIRTYDKAGNYDDTSVEYVNYSNINIGESTLKISSVTVPEVAVKRGDPFSVDVEVKNLGPDPVWVNSVDLTFNLPGTGDVTHQYNYVTDPGGQILGYDDDTYSISVTSDLDAYEGEITVDATMTGDVNDDLDGADPGHDDTIWIREENGIDVSISAPAAVETDSSGNIIDLTITNLMVTDINITSYSLNFTNPTWSLGSDYTISSNPSIGPYGYTLEGNGILDVDFYVDILSGAPESTGQEINYDVYYTEIVSSTSDSEIATPGTTWDVFAPDPDPPDVSNVQANPDPADPEAGDIVYISAVVTDTTGIFTVRAEIEYPDDVPNATLTLYDDGSNGDVVAWDSNFTNTWDCSGKEVGNYYIDIYAEDNSSNNNYRNVNNAKIFTLEDHTNATIHSVSATPNPLELGSTLTINVDVTDYSGISSVTAYIENPDESNIATITLYDDGAHGDGGNGDNVWGNTWDSTGAPALDEYFIDLRVRDASPASNTRYVNNAKTFWIEDTTGPSFGTEAITPDSGDLGQVFQINIDISDDWGLGSVTARIQYGDENDIDSVTLYDDGNHGDGGDGDGIWGNSWDSTGQPEGDYFVDIDAVDSSNNTNSEEAENIDLDIDINDGTAPTVGSVNINPPSGDPEAGTVFTITCVVSDLTGILDVFADIESPNENVVDSVQLYDDGAHSDGTAWDGTFGNTWDSTGENVGNYFVDIRARDNSTAQNPRNINNGDTFTLSDSTQPTLNWIQVSDDPLEVGNTQTITANIIDLSDVSTVIATIESPDETYVLNVTLYDDGAHGDGGDGDNVWGNTWDSTSAPDLDEYFIDITAIDGSLNQNTRNVNNAKTFWIEDTTDPSFGTEAITPDLGEPGQVFQINIDVSDNWGFGSVTARIQFGDENDIDSVTLYDDGNHGDGGDGDGTWGNSWDSTGQPEGTYFVDIDAIDSSNNTNSAEAENIDININVGDFNPPVIGAVNTLPDSGDPQIGGLITISAIITDAASNVLEAFALIEQPDETIIANVTMYDDGTNGGDVVSGDDNWTGQWDFTDQTPTDYFVDIQARDDSIYRNEQNLDNGDTFILNDNTGPNINQMQVISNPLELGNLQTITCNVIDLSGVSSVTAFVQYPDDTNIATITLYDDGAHGDGGDGDNVWGNTWDSTDAPDLDLYNVDFRARDLDTPQNTRNIDNGVTFWIEDTTSPSFGTGAITPDSGDLGQVFQINIDISDNWGLGSVTARIQYGDENDIDSVTLYDDGNHGDGGDDDGTWGNSWDSTGQPEGDYFVDIDAVDSSNNTNSAEAENIDLDITIADGTAPTVGSVNINPSSGDPEAGTVFTITCVVSDLTGILDVFADIESPNEFVIDSVQLYDDGAHGDGTAWDGTFGNTWDSTGENVGNYFVDIRARDNSTAQNPRNINNGDTFTLSDATLPTVTSVSVRPSAGDAQAGGIVTISCIATDLSGISSVYADLDFGGINNIVDTVQLFFNGTHYENTYDYTNDAIGTYWIDIRARDNSIAQNLRTINNGDSYTLSDNTGPSITNGQFNLITVELGSPVIITADVDDLSTISSVWATINISGSFFTGIELFDDGTHNDGADGDGTYGNTWSTSSASTATYTLDINATDSLANFNSDNGVDSIDFRDETEPTIINVDIDPIGGMSGTIFTISADISDLSGITDTWATIYNATASYAWIQLTGSGSYSGSWDSAGFYQGVYNMRVNATDGSTDPSANTGTEIYSSTITITVFDNTPPTISNVQANPNIVNPGTSVSITAQITDDTGLYTPNVTVHNAAETWSVVLTLYDDGTNGGDTVASDNIWSCLWDTSSLPVGIYYVDINATDNSAANNEAFANNNASIELTNDDLETPSVVNISDLPNGNVGDIFTITCDVTDNGVIDDVLAYIQRPDGTTVDTVILYDDGSHSDGGNNDGTYGNTWNSTGFARSPPSYFLDIFANDTFNNINFTDNGDTFTLSDNTGPTVNNIAASIGTLELGDIQTITCNVSDPSGVLSVTAYLENPDETVVAILTLFDDGAHSDGGDNDGIYGNTWNSTGDPVGPYQIDITTLDIYSNPTNLNNQDSFWLNDTIGPTIENGQVSVDPLELGATVNITVDVTDLSTITSVYATIEDGSWIAGILLYDDGFHNDGGATDGTYGNSWDSTGYSTGSYDIGFNATDSETNPASVDDMDTLEIVDNTNPTIENVLLSDDPNLELGSIQTITCDVADLSGILSVTAYIKDMANILITSIVMVDNGTNGDIVSGDGTYTSQWNSTGIATGLIKINITAIDDSPNNNEEKLFDAEVFWLEDTIGPSFIGGSITPDKGEPGQVFQITITVSDESTIGSVTAYVQNPDESTIIGGTITLFDDGTHGDGGDNDGTYGNTWNSAGQAEGFYFVDIIIIDGSNNTNPTEAENIDNDIIIGDSTPPTVVGVDMTPGSGDPDLGTIFTITANASDQSGILSVVAYIESPNETVVDNVVLLDNGLGADVQAGDGKFTGQWDSSLFAVGDYFIEVNVTDNSLAQNVQSVDHDETFTLADGTGPSISGIQMTDNSIELGTNQTIRCTVTDFSGVSTVIATIESPDETYVLNVTLYDDGTNGGDTVASDNIWTGQWDSTGASLAQYFIDIRAIDNSVINNDQEVDNGATFFVEDTIGPSFTAGDISPGSGEPGDTFQININVTDLSGIQSVVAYIQAPDETDIAGPITLFDDGAHGDGGFNDGTYGNTWNSTGWGEDTYFVDIVAIDNSNNTNPAEAENIDSNFALDDTTPPSVSSVEAVPETGDPEAGTSITIRAIVSDPSGILDVWAFIESPNETVIDQIELFDDGLHDDGGNNDALYGNIWVSTSYPIGNYSVDIMARDNSAVPQNTRNIDNGDNFTLVDSTQPTVLNTQVSADPLELGNIQTINAVITDYSGISEVWATIQYPDGLYIAGIQLFDDGAHDDGGDSDGTYGNIWNSTGQAEGTYYVDFNATDASVGANVNITDNGAIFTLADATAPEVTIITANPALGNPEQGDNITISCRVVDESSILSVTAYLENPDETVIKTLILYDDGPAGGHGDALLGDNIYTNRWNTTGANEGIYRVDITAIDNSILQTPRDINNGDTFTLFDATPPAISNVIVTTDPLPITDTQRIYAFITDMYNISSVTAIIESPDEIEIDSITLYDDGTHGDLVADDNNYTNTWDSTGNGEATYFIDIRAIDDSSNKNEQNVDNATEFYIEDLFNPVITSPDINPDSLPEFQDFTITATVTDESGLDSVWATITNTTTGAWIAGVELFDDGNHNDGGAGDDLFGNTWNSTGFSIGDYNLSINATDASSSNHFSSMNNVESFTITEVPPQLDFKEIDRTIEAYIGVDLFTLIFNVSVAIKDITITNISMEFGKNGINNSLFDDRTINGTTPLFPYDLGVSDGYILFNLSYSILPSTPNGLVDDSLIIEYEDHKGTQYSKIQTFQGTIALYKKPEIHNLWVDIEDSNYLGPLNNEITFKVNGTYVEGDLYSVELNLTEFGGSVVSMNYVSYELAYNYTLSGLTRGSYDCSDVDVKISINLPEAGYREDTDSFDEKFYVDMDNPIINESSIDVPVEVDLADQPNNQFKFSINITDNSTSPAISTGIDSVWLEIKDQEQDIELTNSSGNPDIWWVYLSASNLDPDILIYKKGNYIEYVKITAKDRAGNEIYLDLYNKTYIIDDTPPIIDLDSIIIGGQEGLDNLVFPTGEHIGIYIDATDFGGGSGIYSMKIVYKITGGSNIKTSSDNKWEEEDMILVDGKYFAVLSDPDKDGFTEKQKVTFYFVATDNNNNEYSTESDPIELTFKKESILMSQIILFVGLGCLIGALIYRSIIYRGKRARLVDTEGQYT